MTTPEKIDITARAATLDPPLPEAWRVLAWTERDSQVSDPREVGEVYAPYGDHEEANYRDYGHCRHCESWIRKLDQSGAAAINAARAKDDDTRPAARAGDWVTSPVDIGCASSSSGEHESGGTVAESWWRNRAWRVVVVSVEIVDGDGHVRGHATLRQVGQGDFPYRVDPETGRIDIVKMDPLKNRTHPLPALIVQAAADSGWETR